METPYETIRHNITPKAAAEKCGWEVKRGDMCRCPFHEERTPSMKLYDDHFHCFGCGKSGDATALTAQLLHLKNGEAANWLMETFGLTRLRRKQSIPRITPPKPTSQREKESFCFSALWEYYRLLHRWKKELAPTPDLEESKWNALYVLACTELPKIAYKLDILTLGSSADRAALVNALWADGSIRHYRDMVRVYGGGGKNG